MVSSVSATQKGGIEITQKVRNDVADTGEVEGKVGSVHTTRRTISALKIVSVETSGSDAMHLTQLEEAVNRFAGKALQEERNGPYRYSNTTHYLLKRPDVDSDRVKEAPEEGEEGQFHRL